MWEYSLIVGGFASLLGTSLASFLTCVSQRIHENKPWVTAKSVCDHCKKPLAWRDNLPIVSVLMNRGQSRCCQRVLSKKYLYTEILGAVVGFSLGVWLAEFLIQGRI